MSSDTLHLGSSTLSLTQGDLTLEDCDAIVNAANSFLLGGGGVDGAIHRRSGPAILETCKAWVTAHGRLPAGHAMITPGGNLRARWVIHTVGPVYHGKPKDAEILSSAYAESLKLAEEKGLRTIAFPSISTGAYGYPLEEAAPIALGAIARHLKAGSRITAVRMVLFDARTLDAYRAALGRMG